MNQFSMLGKFQLILAAVILSDAYELLPEDFKGCKTEFSYSECVYYIYCKDQIQFDISCPCCQFGNGTAIYIYYRRYSPVKLFYESNHIPFFWNWNINLYSNPNSYYTSLFNAIELLDISNHYIDSTTSMSLKNMSSLKTLNLSRNILTEAKLYSTYPRKSLINVDYSQNRIKNIQSHEEIKYCFSNLEVLNVSYNEINDILEDDLECVQKLKVLDLSHNSIESPSAVAFSHLNKINYLSLAYNQILELNSSISGLTQLQFLYLNNNKLKILKENDFDNLKNLEELNLSSNLLTSVENTLLKYTNKLYDIDLSLNHLTVIHKDLFKNVVNLTRLDLSYNEIQNLPIDFLKGKNISTFKINNNSLTGSLSKGSFSGLELISYLDLSYQSLGTIDNFTFFGCNSMEKLLFNNNLLQFIGIKAFATMHNLKFLDLSNNFLKFIYFENLELVNLFHLSIANNLLTEISTKNSVGIVSLQFVDISDNNISNIEPNSFEGLVNLKTLQMSRNPLEGNLSENTFKGLISLPVLDLSNTQFTAVNNNSLVKMTTLQTFNLSNSLLSNVQYDAFHETGNIKILDLSYNKLIVFDVNSTDLANLLLLYLNNNNIKQIDHKSFNDMMALNTLKLSHNELTDMQSIVLENQKDLQILDVSYNHRFQIYKIKLTKSPNLTKVIISGTDSSSGVLSSFFGESLLRLEMTNANITDIKAFNLTKLAHLETLLLDKNNISTITTKCFTGLKNVDSINLSFNNISKIYPRSFSTNSKLKYLDLSHNNLKYISYGIFQGLVILKSLDLSFNRIEKIQNEHFYDAQNLETLIVDHNHINYIDPGEFSGTAMSKLSIGDNPLPCDMIAMLMKNNTFSVEGLNSGLDSDYEMFNGVTCNVVHHPQVLPDFNSVGKEKVLEGMRSILSKNVSSVLQNILEKQSHDHKQSFLLTEVCTVLIFITFVIFVVYYIVKSKITLMHTRSQSSKRIFDTIENINL